MRVVAHRLEYEDPSGLHLMWKMLRTVLWVVEGGLSWEEIGQECRGVRGDGRIGEWRGRGRDGRGSRRSKGHAGRDGEWEFLLQKIFCENRWLKADEICGIR